MFLLLLLACTDSAPVDTGPDTRPWTGGSPGLAEEIGGTRNFTPLRTIAHLHSPYSHDACDGEGLIEGVPDAECLADLRAGLCTTRFDVAFVTDHPSHAAEQSYTDLMHHQEGDSWVEVSGVKIGNRIDCGDGHQVLYLPGIEDDLMPLGLEDHVADTSEENDRLYNGSDSEAMLADLAVGAEIFVAHTEQRDPVKLATLQQQGLRGVELFNLHAMFGPDIRQEAFGLDPFGWLADAMPFTDPEGTAEPGLLFLAVLQEQAPTIERWGDLLAVGPTVGIAGTDAHQNTLPRALRDGERGDSYRRMMRWFSNVLLAEEASAEGAKDALAAGRLYVAFETLGTPAGFDLHLTADRIYEMGENAPLGTLSVTCPTLSEHSPRGEQAPEITATIYKDNVPWKTACGTYKVTEPGVYRVRIDQVPHHLAPFLGPDPEVWMRPFPWIYSNALRVGL